MIKQYWSTLEIEPTDDKRSIKKAYAKKLKFCKPEKDPEGFKKLREAYEYLSNIDNVQEYQPADIFSYHDGEVNFNSSFQDEETPSEQLIHQLYLLAEDDTKRKILDSWKSILIQVDGLDIQEKRTVSIECFRFLLGYAEQIKQGSPPGTVFQIPRALIDYFDNIFYWSQDSSLELYFEEEELEQLITLPTTPSLKQFNVNTYSEADMHTRAVMTIIDIIICVVPALLASVFLSQIFPKIPLSENEVLVTSGFCIYLIYSFCFEMSKWKGSVGKRVANLQILNKKGEQSTIIELIWRGCLKSVYVGTAYIIYFEYEFTGFISGYLASFVVFYFIQFISPAKVYQFK